MFLFHHYGFFDYAVNEVLHLSAEEEDDLITILHKIDKECQHIDKHTQETILTQIGSRLKYSNRFYERQFLTRKNNNSALLSRFGHTQSFSPLFEKKTNLSPLEFRQTFS